MLRLMIYNEHVLRHKLVKVDDQSCVISEARMTMSFQHRLIIGVEPIIIDTAFFKCHVLDEKCPLVGAESNPRAAFRASRIYPSIARSSLLSNGTY